MKVETISQFTDKDPVDIRELLSGESARRTKRLMLMRQFLSWAYFKEKKRWVESNNEERIIVYRHFGHVRFMLGMGCFSTFFIYNVFFRGTYTFRSRELLNMR